MQLVCAEYDLLETQVHFVPRSLSVEYYAFLAFAYRTYICHSEFYSEVRGTRGWFTSVTQSDVGGIECSRNSMHLRPDLGD